MIILMVDGATSGDDFFEGLSAVVSRFTGTEALTLRLPTHELELGWAWQVDGSEQCVTALSEFGAVSRDPSSPASVEGRSPGA